MYKNEPTSEQHGLVKIVRCSLLINLLAPVNVALVKMSSIARLCRTNYDVINVTKKMANNGKQVEVTIAPAPRCKSCTPRLTADPQNIKTTACMKILSVLGHKSLDEKLLQHDIRRKRSKSARFVRNLMSKSLSEVRTPGFKQEDLQKLTTEQLQSLHKSFAKKVTDKKREHGEVLEIKAKETERMIQLMAEIQNIEEAAKTRLKPCINVLPDSDDMARVLLLN